MMVSRALPLIYQRLWRPLGGRLLMGSTEPETGEEHRMALSMLAISPGDRVLDVACGPGNFARDFARAAGARRDCPRPRAGGPAGDLDQLQQGPTARRRQRHRARFDGVQVFGRDELTRALFDDGLVEIDQQVTGLAQFVSAHKPEVV